MLSIKAIFFDLDNTLVDCATADTRTYEIIAFLSHQNNSRINTPQLIKDFKELFTNIPFDPNGQIPFYPWRTILWQKALAAQEMDDPILAEKMNKAFHSERLAFYTFIPGTQEMLTALLSKYIGVIITNGASGIQRPKLKACNAYDYFDHILVGGEEPYEKPHPSIFYKACDLVKCTPEEAVIVGDSLATDIQGGLSSGLASTIWVNPKNKTIPEKGPYPDFQIFSVLELPLILTRI